MKMVKLILLSCLLTATSWVSADALPDHPYIAVSGSAKIQVKPDTAKIEFQSTTVENDAESAKQVVDKQVQQILVQLEKNGFAQKLLTRADIQLTPEYEYIEKKRTQVGIKAIRNLSYQLGDVTKLNELLKILVEADIANIGRINYALKDPVKWQSKARDLAVKDSITKAKGLAESYQASLGKIYSINYQDKRSQPILMRSIASDQSVPSYQNNQIVIDQQVDAVFLLKP
ncbi:DUF541 domain-containing protein [Psychromonas sp. RZ22]|uniref:SIMPL domain-containing protein n=1 Tax=Psychromonas algarum TaxID=2555643 RepID=UPI001068CDA4|nr:SIMPL domain-containing protein [Psychromonas sp. RZ22]TEW56841.1 DUF541 domain-containing protein [Psychromonas sp. RZ22]